MKVLVQTNDPTSLIGYIRQYIQRGRIRTWEENTQGCFTHTGENNRWRFKAFFQPIQRLDGVQFDLLPPTNGTIDLDILGIYAGSWTSELIRHFGNQIQAITIN